MSRTDNDTALADIIREIAKGDGLHAVFSYVDAYLKKSLEPKFFSLSLILPDDDHARRVFSSAADAYAVGEDKAMGDTPFGERVIQRCEHFIGNDTADIVRAFPDHEKVLASGLENFINMPSVFLGRCYGTTNVFGLAGKVGQRHVDILQPLAAIMVPVFMYLLAQER